MRQWGWNQLMYRKQQRRKRRRSSRTDWKGNGRFGSTTSLNLSKVLLGGVPFGKSTPSTPSKSSGVCMIKYLSQASSLQMLISTCSKLELSPSGKIQSAPVEESGLLPAAERVTSTICGLKQYRDLSLSPLFCMFIFRI